MTTRLTTAAVLLKAPTPVGESSLVVPLFTEAQGRVTTFARAARRSSKRFPVIEAFHTLVVEIDPPTRELPLLASAVVSLPRLGVLVSLPRMQAAGRALGWVAQACPERSPEPAVWTLVTQYLDTVHRCREADVLTETAAFGVKLLGAVGWAPPTGALRRGMGAERAVSVVEQSLQAHAGR